MNKILGILWDYDGTIIDTASKNILVNIEVLKHFDKDIEKHLPKALQSYNAYQIANHKYKNWKELYMNEFGIKEQDLSTALSLWAPSQTKVNTIPNMFSGMDKLFKDLSIYKMGICSQNSKEIIINTLKHYNVIQYFTTVIGAYEVSINSQKPNPEGFINCTKILNPNNEDGIYIYIGDHSDDVVFGKNAEQILGKKVICITIDHLGLNRDKYKSWNIPPDYYTDSVESLTKVLKKL